MGGGGGDEKIYSIDHIKGINEMRGGAPPSPHEGKTYKIHLHTSGGGGGVPQGKATAANPVLC